jgi:O-antigen/teichoic acid export membrane protein
MQNVFKRVIDFFLKGKKRSVVIKKNIVASVLIKGIGIGLTFLLVPLLLNYLEPVKYGLWLTIASIIQWFWLFDIGLGNGLRNKFAEAKALNEVEKAKIYVSTSYYILTIISMVTIILFLPLAFFINWAKVLNAPLALGNEIKQIVIIVFVLFMMRFVLQLIGTLLLGDQKTALNDSINLASNLLVVVLILGLNHFYQNSFLLACIALTISPIVVYSFISLYFFRNDYKAFAPSIKHIKISFGKSLLNLGMLFFIVQIAGIILYSTTNLLIIHLLSPAEVTEYNIAFKYFSGIFMLFSIIINPFWSAFTDAFSLRDISWIKRIISKLRRIGFVFIGILFVMIIVADSFYEFWVGSIKIDYHVTILMGLFFSISIINMPFCYFLNGVGRVKEQAIMATLAALVHIPLSIFFVKHLNMGLQGIILSLVLVGLPSLIIWPYLYKKEISCKSVMQS